MNLKDILAISGEGTLFKFIAQGKNAVIVENLETGRRLSAGATAKVSALEEIAIFTTGEDMPLGKVMDKIWEKENGGEALSHKLPDTDLKKYFAEVFPEYDRDRVYTSDIKKVLHWYNMLHKLNLLVKEEEVKEGEEDKVEKGEEEAPSHEPRKPKEEVKAKTKAKPQAKEKKAAAVRKDTAAPGKTTVKKKASKV
jgi:hypothetical protein